MEYCIPPSYYPHLHPRDGPRLHHLFPVKGGDFATEKWVVNAVNL